MGCDETLGAAYKVMATRFEKRVKNKETKWDRLNNPLPATLTTTGGGKSFFLDEFGALNPADLNFCSNPDMREILQNSVSYNNNKCGDCLTSAGCCVDHI